MADPGKLQAALRRNRGRSIRDQWLNDLAKTCRTSLTSADLIDVSETARLKSAFVAKLLDKDCPPVTDQWTKDRESEAYAVVAEIGRQCVGIKVALFSSVDELIGACTVDASAVLIHAADVWKVVKDDVNLVTMDLADGLSLQQNYYSTDGVFVKGGVIDLSVWGRFALSER
jgi:hypothetical protein